MHTPPAATLALVRQCAAFTLSKTNAQWPGRARWHHPWPQLAFILRSFNWKRLQNCCFRFSFSGQQTIQNEQVIHQFVRHRNGQCSRSHLMLSVQTEPLYNIVPCYIWQHWGKQAKVLWTPVLHQRSRELSLGSILSTLIQSVSNVSQGPCLLKCCAVYTVKVQGPIAEGRLLLVLVTFRQSSKCGTTAGITFHMSHLHVEDRSAWGHVIWGWENGSYSLCSQFNTILGMYWMLYALLLFWKNVFDCFCKGFWMNYPACAGPRQWTLNITLPFFP